MKTVISASIDAKLVFLMQRHKWGVSRIIEEALRYYFRVIDEDAEIEKLSLAELNAEIEKAHMRELVLLDEKLRRNPNFQKEVEEKKKFDEAERQKKFAEAKLEKDIKAASGGGGMRV